MKFTMGEVGVLIAALNLKSDGTARMFQAIQLPDIASIVGKLKKLVNKDGLIPPGDHEIELGTDEKKLIKDCLEERDWSSGDAEAVITVTEKLK